MKSTESSFLYVAGEKFNCKCGCNLFHKHTNTLGIWICNCCGEQYIDPDKYKKSTKQ